MALKLERDLFYEPIAEWSRPIYKYFCVNENTKDSLKEAYLWLSSPTTFNDPFDTWTEFVSFNPSAQQINEMGERASLQFQREQFDNFVTSRPDQFRQAFYQALRGTVETRGVCCFSKNNESILMWSHYADRHRGLCLGFDPNESRLDLMPAFDVRYTLDFQPVNYFSMSREALIFMHITKSVEWQYEKEVRILRDRVGRMPFKREALREVIFGCRIDQSAKDDIIDIVENNYKGVVFKQAKMIPGKFGLEFI